MHKAKFLRCASTTKTAHPTLFYKKRENCLAKKKKKKKTGTTLPCPVYITLKTLSPVLVYCLVGHKSLTDGYWARLVIAYHGFCTVAGTEACNWHSTVPDTKLCTTSARNRTRSPRRPRWPDRFCENEQKGSNWQWRSAKAKEKQKLVWSHSQSFNKQGPLPKACRWKCSSKRKSAYGHKLTLSSSRHGKHREVNIYETKEEKQVLGIKCWNDFDQL